MKHLLRGPSPSRRSSSPPERGSGSRRASWLPRARRLRPRQPPQPGGSGEERAGPRIRADRAETAGGRPRGRGGALGRPSPPLAGVRDPARLAVAGARPASRCRPNSRCWRAGTPGRTTPRRRSSGCWCLPRHGGARRQRRLLPGDGRRRRREPAAAHAAAAHPRRARRWWSTPGPPSSASAATPGALLRRGRAGGRGDHRRRDDARGRGPRAGRHATVANVRIEHQGPLSAVVVIDGAYDLPPVGGGRARLAPALRLHRRLPHRGGPPAVAWEGNLGCRGASTTKEARPTACSSSGCATRSRSTSGSRRPPRRWSAPSRGRGPGRRRPVRAGTGDGADRRVRQRLRPPRAAPLPLRDGRRRTRRKAGGRRDARRVRPRGDGGGGARATCTATSRRPSACWPTAAWPWTWRTTRPGSPTTRGCSPPSR